MTEEKKTEYLYYCDLGVESLTEELTLSEKVQGCRILEPKLIQNCITKAHNKVGGWKGGDLVPLTVQVHGKTAEYSKIQGQGKLDGNKFTYYEYRKIGEKGDWRCYAKLEVAAMCDSKIKFTKDQPDNDANQEIVVMFNAKASDTIIQVPDENKGDLSLCAVELVKTS
jgi:hypothetical protein